MSEKHINKVEKSDITAPHLSAGESAIILQRHEKYIRDKSSELVGSIDPEHIDDLYNRDKEFFKHVFSEDNQPGDTMVLFISSNTRYHKGYRSVETAQVAQEAAVDTLQELGLNPEDQIINLNPHFKTDNFNATTSSIRPDSKLREPDIFAVPEYVDYLRAKYGDADGLSQKAWAAHERDADKQKREELGAEGVYDVVDRTKKALGLYERYARVFHANHPDKKLIIWAASHYDTISPLVKDVTGADFGDYVPVDYAAGVVITLSREKVPTLNAQGKKVPVRLGEVATKGL